MPRCQPFWVFLLACLLLTACASPRPDATWETHTIRLGEARVTLSAPPAKAGTNLPSVDLATNTKRYIVLFKRVWIDSGLLSDKGLVDLSLLLDRHHARAFQQPFMDAVRADYEADFGRVVRGVELVNHTTRMIGGQQWTCFEVTKIQVPDCVLELPDGQHYLVWRRRWIANAGERVPANVAELSDTIERSIEVAF